MILSNRRRGIGALRREPAGESGSHAWNLMSVRRIGRSSSLQGKLCFSRQTLSIQDHDRAPVGTDHVVALQLVKGDGDAGSSDAQALRQLIMSRMYVIADPLRHEQQASSKPGLNRLMRGARDGVS
jgi:hypothetical protein